MRNHTQFVDAQIGHRVRVRRTLLGMSQEKLGQLLGLTFQQIQKYERGINRISAGRLLELALGLGVPITYFYEGLSIGTPGAPAKAGAMQGFPLSGQDLKLSLAFTRIKDVKLRKNLIGLVESLAAPDSTESQTYLPEGS